MLGTQEHCCHIRSFALLLCVLQSSSAPPKRTQKKRGLAGAVGLGAALSMAAAQQAEAATELSQLAASDNR
jgi:hypothetical protein